MRTINPATGLSVRDYAEHSAEEVERRLQAAAVAYGSWRETSFAERAARLRAAAHRLRESRDDFARLMTEEMGKPIAQAEAEVDKCSAGCEHFAEHAERMLAPEPVATEASLSLVRCDPLGPILAVMPWNFPFWQVFRAAAPALMAGNVLVLKHASNVPGCALAIERLFSEAGFPRGVFTTLLVPAAAAEALVDHPVIQAATLTGSEAAGAALAARAGRALKKIVLELGGSDPFIVLADADPAAVAAKAVAARLINNGQSCIAAKRFIVEEPIVERFEWAFAQRMARQRLGDPLDRATELGPLARADLVDDLERQVQTSIERGARLLTGGTRPARPGFFYAPTVLGAVAPGMPAFDEETFGPVAAVVRAGDAAHAVELANHSRFGLGASVWTADPRRGQALAAALEAGVVFVNGPVKSDPRLPFGGVKRSGFGRELGAPGIREFVNLKTVWVK
ncbi:MAG TPA: NAD-dependent succinate-semialdehyde dehydrogenase [Candidatus Eisenbacteria bacterium]|jgi:succinate-semialdehyde dehydrogenase/glutarate-semialdehyde dehydrogenase